jgi:hypothetical protein
MTSSENGSKVFIVTSGQYADYRIEAVFTTLEKAEGYYSSLDDEHKDIMEWPVDVIDPHVIHRGLHDPPG